MIILKFLGISDALADTAPVAAAAAPHQNFLSMMLVPLLIVVVFYFLLIRPQSKRAKEHRSLIEKLSVNDEVLTAGGIIGKVIKLRDNFIVIQIDKTTEIVVQKNSIASVLPKGTLDSIL